MSSNLYFRTADPKHFSVLMTEMATVVCVLNEGRTGGLGAVAIHASKKGYRITLGGKTLASGSTPNELHKSFTAAVERAKKA